MKIMELNEKQIETQVERWDTFARIVPTIFLVVAGILVATGVINFEQAFYVGLGLFAVTAVTWWFWTIYTIRLLVKTLNRASKNLSEVRNEFKAVSREVQELRNEQ
tara:strand:- start:243 stop:560 length:318 start_codon:yes stop_codon:yes gene_type:complete